VGIVWIKIGIGVGSCMEDGNWYGIRRFGFP